jgi:hypothetical protein
MNGQAHTGADPRGAQGLPLSSLVYQAGLTYGASRRLPSLAECAAEGKARGFR